MAKVRVDQALVDRGLAPSRTRAQALIMAGAVYVEDRRIDKAGELVAEGAPLRVRGEDHPWVSRGGVKLAGALEGFGIDVTDADAVDVGASTGGFTDVLLARGARRVFAVDVGYGQLHDKLRKDPRVVVLERTNARTMTPATLGLPGPVLDLAVADASFIGLDKLLPAIAAVLRPGAALVALVKPQFQLRREQIGKGGIVRDPASHAEAVEIVRSHCAATGLEWLGVTDSPITGTDGNREFLCRVAGSSKRQDSRFKPS
ncbi:MAG: TlyA family RNA methyltransferase [Verrucomicrobia bacterium]|nr:TlyA family RNA methyltransferase [Verrucomicrobiota bacterium]